LVKNPLGSGKQVPAHDGPGPGVVGLPVPHDPGSERRPQKLAKVRRAHRRCCQDNTQIPATRPCPPPGAGGSFAGLRCTGSLGPASHPLRSEERLRSRHPHPQHRVLPHKMPTPAASGWLTNAPVPSRLLRPGEKDFEAGDRNRFAYRREGYLLPRRSTTRLPGRQVARRQEPLRARKGERATCCLRETRGRGGLDSLWLTEKRAARSKRRLGAKLSRKLPDEPSHPHGDLAHLHQRVRRHLPPVLQLPHHGNAHEHPIPLDPRAVLAGLLARDQKPPHRLRRAHRLEALPSRSCSFRACS